MKKPSEVLHELIDASTLVPIQKNIIKGFIDRSQDKETEDRNLRELLHSLGVSNATDIVLDSPTVLIYLIQGKDEWDIKYPYRVCYRKDTSQKWQLANTVSPTLDLAMLVSLQVRYLGYNSQFIEFATKMLEIPTE